MPPGGPPTHTPQTAPHSVTLVLSVLGSPLSSRRSARWTACRGSDRPCIWPGRSGFSNSGCAQEPARSPVPEGQSEGAARHPGPSPHRPGGGLLHGTGHRRHRGSGSRTDRLRLAGSHTDVFPGSHGALHTESAEQTPYELRVTRTEEEERTRVRMSETESRRARELESDTEDMHRRKVGPQKGRGGGMSSVTKGLAPSILLHTG